MQYDSDSPLEVYARRRAKVMKRLRSGVLVLKNPPENAEGRYRPSPYLYYLTGLAEPEAWAILAPEHEKHPYVLFVQPRDPQREVWDGPRLGPRRAKRRLGADAVYPVGELDQRAPGYLRAGKRLYAPLGQDDGLDQKALEWLKQARGWRIGEGKGPAGLEDARDLLDELRLVKDAHELELLRRAAEIGMAGHRAAMQAVQPGMREYELEAVVENTFRRLGAEGPAFPTIVAAGANGTVLHYVANNARIGPHDLVVLDAGARYAGYASDITRTFPASGAWTDQQAALYDCVLEAQRQAIAAMQPGEPVEGMHTAAVKALTQGLLDLGLLQGRRPTLIRQKAYRRFYMHGSGHPLGLQVHDVGPSKVNGQPRPFVPGMVYTVEPGLYISSQDREVERRWRGIGVRIEDDVLVTKNGPVVLTEAVPKTREAIAELQGLRTEP